MGRKESSAHGLQATPSEWRTHWVLQEEGTEYSPCEKQRPQARLAFLSAISERRGTGRQFDCSTSPSHPTRLTSVEPKQSGVFVGVVCPSSLPKKIALSLDGRWCPGQGSRHTTLVPCCCLRACRFLATNYLELVCDSRTKTNISEEQQGVHKSPRGVILKPSKSILKQNRRISVCLLLAVRCLMLGWCEPQSRPVVVVVQHRKRRY